jgi:hypothetical protein
MKESGDRVVMGNVTAWALMISQLESSTADLVAIVTPEGSDVERMNESTHRSIAMLLEPSAGNGNSIRPLFAAPGIMVVRYQNACHDQNAACLRRKH